MPSIRLRSPGFERRTWARGTLRGWNQALHISNVVMILAPVLIAISSADPTSSVCPSATRMTSTLEKSGTFTGLSGLATNGLVRTTFPVGEVKRKIDHDSHSILTGPDCANAFDP